MSAVTAIVHGGRTAAPGAEHVVEIATLAELPRAAEEASTPLLWLLGAGVTASEATLPALLAEPERPALSLPVDEAGAPVDALVGRFADTDAERVLRAARARTLPLRHAPVLSMLVARETVATAPAPDPGRYGPYAGTVWTAALFARAGGVLVPASTIRVDVLPPPSPSHALRVARSGAWRRPEAVREVALALRPSRSGANLTKTPHNAA